MRPLAWLASVAALVQGTAPLDADPFYCSRWQGITTCSSPGGYVSHETQWQRFTLGDDNQGNRWTTSRWQGIDITTVEPPGR
jgi:hypothetical protein